MIIAVVQVDMFVGRAYGQCVFLCDIFFYDTAATEIYTYRHTLSLHDALPICWAMARADAAPRSPVHEAAPSGSGGVRTERELMAVIWAVAKPSATPLRRGDIVSFAARVRRSFLHSLMCATSPFSGLSLD